MSDSYPLTHSRLAESDQIECPIRFHSRTTPKHIAVWAPGKSISYNDLDQAVSTASARLTVGSSQDRIAVCLKEPFDTIVWLFASLRARTEVFLISRRLPGSARVKACSASGVRRYVSDVGIDLEGGISIHPSTGDEDEIAPALYKRMASTVQDAACTLSLDAPATLMYTSGTAGASKIVVHTLRNHLSSALSSNSRIAVSASSRWLLSLPLDHVAGLGILFRTFVAGGAVALHDSMQTIGTAIDETRSTHVSLVSTQLQRLLDEKSAAPISLKEVLVGGGPIYPSLIRRAIESGYPVRTTYGMTEMSSQISTSDIWTEIRKEYSSGRVLPLMDLKLDTEREIYVRGPSAFLGYLDSQGLLMRREPGAWIQTGDTGIMKGEELKVTGRQDDMFVSGGENIRPEEIERALLEIDGVEMAIVVPVSDVEFGFRPVAFVRCFGRPVDADSIIGQLREKLASLKIPDRILNWPPEMETESMKVDRRRLRELAASI